MPSAYASGRHGPEPVFVPTTMPPILLAPDALRDYRLFESSDLDETRERISRVMQPHRLEPAGKEPARSYMDFVKLGGMGLGAISFGGPMHVNVESIDGYYLLMFCLKGSADVRTVDTVFSVDRSTAVLCSPGTPFDARLSADCEQFVLRIDAASFRPALGVPTMRVAPRIAIDSPSLRGWAAQLRALTRSPALLECARSSAGVAAHMEHLLVTLLADALPALLVDHKPAIPAFVKRAEAFIRANIGEPLQLEEIARAAGVSARTLRERFQSAHGVSPMQYLRDVRMERARESLLQAGTRGRIADIALACGFLHFGRFSAAYAKVFGESPSDTLRRR